MSRMRFGFVVEGDKYVAEAERGMARLKELHPWCTIDVVAGKDKLLGWQELAKGGPFIFMDADTWALRRLDDLWSLLQRGPWAVSGYQPREAVEGLGGVGPYINTGFIGLTPDAVIHTVQQAIRSGDTRDEIAVNNCWMWDILDGTVQPRVPQMWRPWSYVWHSWVRWEVDMGEGIREWWKE
jgi:hypothetical protein